MNFQDGLNEHLGKFNTSPFLFVGSGFSRRCYGPHIWENLLMATNDTSEKLRVVDFVNETDLDKVDVVIGVGIEASKKTEKSYDTFGRFDIARDVLQEQYNLNPDELCLKTLPKLCRVGAWIPVY